MPWALIAIAAMQAGFAVYQQNQQVKAANKAQQQAAEDAVSNQNALVLEQQKKRRQAQGTALGGSPAAEQIARQGSVLTSTPQTRSLLGG